MEVFNFPAQLQAERKYMFTLNDDYIRREHTAFVCVYLPAAFQWKVRSNAKSWRFDKSAAVALKLQELLASHTLVQRRV
eukprot:Skav207710  [mRNA]  locus=scaffold1347:73331:75230:+ [translate_table: standard]